MSSHTAADYSRTMTRHTSLQVTLSAPEIKPLLVSSVVTRLPLAIFSIALLVHAQRLTGSFAVAAAVTGAYAIASALSLCLATTRMQECEEGQTRTVGEAFAGGGPPSAHLSSVDTGAQTGRGVVDP